MKKETPVRLGFSLLRAVLLIEEVVALKLIGFSAVNFIEGTFDLVVAIGASYLKL